MTYHIIFFTKLESLVVYALNHFICIFENWNFFTKKEKIILNSNNNNFIWTYIPFFFPFFSLGLFMSLLLYDFHT